MEYSLFLLMIVILLMVYMGTLVSSTKRLLNLTPSTNELNNFKVVHMINLSKGKLTGSVFVLLGLIVLAVGSLWITPFNAQELFNADLKTIKNISAPLLMLWAAGFLYTNAKLNRLFNETNLVTGKISFQLRHRIERYTDYNNMLFILFCVTLTFQFLLYGLGKV